MRAHALILVGLFSGCLPAQNATPAPADSTPPPATGSDGGAASDLAQPQGASDRADAAVVEGPPTTASLVEDFESATLDPARWTVLGKEGHQQPGPTTAVLDTTRAHRGKQSLHVDDGFIETRPPSTAFYGRAYVWFDADPGAGHWMSWVAVGPGGSQGTEVRYGGHYDILQANYFGNDDEVISDPKGYCSPTCTNGVSVPVKQWKCVEFYFGKDEIRLWLDGAEVDTLHVTKWRNQTAPWSPAYDHVRLGFHDFQGGAVGVWYDDVAFDTHRIGCTP